MDAGAMADVVIVGGRPAGASLAARLGARGLRVVLLERATGPSHPGVPSSPVIYPGAMAELDALGVPEERYAHAAARMSRFTFEFAGAFTASMDLPRMWGRDHLYGIDRAAFDEVLWQHAGACPTVTQRRGFAVSELLRDERGRVCGVVGGARGGQSQRISARCVIGADGRFSLVAREAGARLTDEETRCVSTVYFAEWEGVAPFAPGPPAGHVHTTGRGLDVLFFEMPGGRTSINTHARADRVDIRGDAQAYYVDTLRGQPEIAPRLARAKQVTAVRGVKRVGNGYRTPSGPGWALVGDAVHFKDPVDGQGIYDALVGARLLDAALARALSAEASWDEAMEGYRRALDAATRDMYRETVERLRRELYQEPPAIVVRTLIRWMMTDPSYQGRFMRYLGREISPRGWNGPAQVGAAVLRGLWRDLRGA